MGIEIALAKNNLLGVNDNRQFGPVKIGKNHQLSEFKEKKLNKACQDFEAIFVNIMLKQMRKTVPQSEFLGNSREEKIFREMLDEKLSDQIAKTKALGLAHILYNQVRVKTL